MALVKGSRMANLEEMGVYDIFPDAVVKEFSFLTDEFGFSCKVSDCDPVYKFVRYKNNMIALDILLCIDHRSQDIEICISEILDEDHIPKDVNDLMEMVEAGDYQNDYTIEDLINIQGVHDFMNYHIASVDDVCTILRNISARLKKYGDEMLRGDHGCFALMKANRSAK